MSYTTKIFEILPKGINDTPPHSIPEVQLPSIITIDDVVDADTHQKLWNYLLIQTWHHVWSGIPPHLQIYKPSECGNDWASFSMFKNNVHLPRCLFGSDEASIKKDHILIWLLWKKINAALGNAYEITGYPEGMNWKDYPCPVPQDKSLKEGWRVYANANLDQNIMLTGNIHRDNPDLYDDSSVTIIWFANLEWYPSWGSELLFYPEDPADTTGDHQQFSGDRGTVQRRNFKIGWPDQGRLVNMKPNRIVVYDSRTLHTSLPTRFTDTPQRRIVFRARKKLTSS